MSAAMDARTAACPDGAHLQPAVLDHLVPEHEVELDCIALAGVGEALSQRRNDFASARMFR
jgi:hypothetical protein